MFDIQDEPMRQQIDATVTMTFDADASLDVAQITAAINADIWHLLTPTGHSPVDLISFSIHRIKEEAEIYSGEPPEAQRELLHIVDRYTRACRAYLPDHLQQAFCGIYAAADEAMAKADASGELAQ